MANPLSDPNDWIDQEANTPPSQWDGVAYEWLGVFGAGAPEQFIDFIGDTSAVPESFSVSVSTGTETFDIPHVLRVVWNADEEVVETFELTPETTEQFTLTKPAGTLNGLFIQVTSNSGEYPYAYSMDVAVTPIAQTDAVSYNCDCDDQTNAKTLKQLRDDLARRLGYGAQVDNLPPGMTELLNSFLIEAQELLYRRYNVLRTERMYTWPLEQGVRMYDLPDNAETCTKKLDPRSVTWVGAIRDGIWYPLVCGIPPEMYSHDITGYPERYEIRQCIEVWPAPEATEGHIAIKGHFGLEAFAVDADKVTIDDRAVFLLSLANAKSHYRQPDAQNYVQQLEVFIDNMVAGAHHTRRYIPGRTDRGDYVYVQPKPLVPFS